MSTITLEAQLVETKAGKYEESGKDFLRAIFGILDGSFNKFAFTIPEEYSEMVKGLKSGDKVQIQVALNSGKWNKCEGKLVSVTE